MATDFRTLPGYANGTSLRTRNIFSNSSPSQIQYFSSLAVIDGALSRDTGSVPTDVLRAGLIMGKITTGGKYRPSILGLITAQYTSGGTSLTVPATVATEVARLITLAAGNVSLKAVGPPTAAGTVAVTSVTASAASGTTITVTSLGVDKAPGTILCPADGSQTPLTVIPNLAGIDVVDTTSTSVDQGLQLFLRGADFISTQIINLVTDDFSNTVDTSVQTWIKQQLNGGGTATRGLFTFDNDR